MARSTNGSGDLIVLACHVISQSHVIKSLCDLKEPLKVSYHSANFGGHRHSDRGDVMVFVCHVISQDQVIKWSCDFVGRSPSSQVNILQSLMSTATLVAELNS